MEGNNKKTKGKMSRRDFIKTTSAVSLAAAVSRVGPVFAAGSDKLRVGLIGAGGRGTGAAMDCVRSSPNIVITAVGDIFKDRWEGSLKRLKERLPKESVAVTPDSCFDGFDFGLLLSVAAGIKAFRPGQEQSPIPSACNII